MQGVADQLYARWPRGSRGRVRRQPRAGITIQLGVFCVDQIHKLMGRISTARRRPNCTQMRPCPTAPQFCLTKGARGRIGHGRAYGYADLGGFLSFVRHPFPRGMPVMLHALGVLL